MATNRGQKRASTRKSNGYWNRQKARTARNIIKKLTRHIERHPNDLTAPPALERRRKRLKV